MHASGIMVTIVQIEEIGGIMTTTATMAMERITNTILIVTTTEMMISSESYKY